jgi:hypothetical protein
MPAGITARRSIAIIIGLRDALPALEMWRTLLQEGLKCLACLRRMQALAEQAGFGIEPVDNFLWVAA